MSEESIFHDPVEQLLHDHRHWRDLFAEYAQIVPGEEARQGEVLHKIEEDLRHHVLLNERLVFPSVMTLNAKAAGPVVRALRGEQEELLKACRDSARSGAADQAGKVRSLYTEVEQYAEFEEKRLVPWIQRLPEVTLHQMSLEIDELAGKSDAFDS